MLRPIFLLLFGLCLSAGADEIRISASDLLDECVRGPLAELGETDGIEIRIDGIGSLPSMDRMRSNEVDLAIIAVPEGGVVPRDEYTVFPFAYDVAVVVVSANNPMNEISLGRLGGVFGSSEELNFNTWGELGLSGWGNRSIKPLAGQDESTVSLELFKYTVLRSGVMKPAVDFVRVNEVVPLVASDAASIAIMPRVPRNNAVKSLLVSKNADSPAFGPTEENVHYGDYPIRLAFYIVLRSGDAQMMKPIVRTLLGDDVAAELKESGLVPLPGTVRRKLTIDLDLEG